ncbi:Protein LYRIC Lysine-rich CEACAM1 co-isolated protein Metadherin Metastasis adhesion protein [Channa argus]|uniref:Protein LYRIC Lysine-rich CEACAM1 co-isolated protein Metadherin Metastasis adhesion protein n=1 Tax=Channa argus TaxID=215402 RepID=A0A6G1QXR1_CHAAH|nr:Protein LYRIC Lysine-rich CEACAM1 co-isolated protein Metadherin Metastasis adhesion protein [Channa argus]KAK2921049.1 hypothetical protein Q8A73_000534 [Channa argus]
MAGDLKGFALDKAELLSSRLKDLLSSGQVYVRAQFGVDLGLKPELYPTWVILCTAAAGLLLILCLSWAAVCGGAFDGKKRGSPVIPSSGEAAKANLSKAAKPEEQKKKSKKKTPDKKTHSNGQPVTVAQEEVKVTEAVSKSSPQTKTEKGHEVQSPVQVKKNKKKTKTNVKPVQHLSTNDGKEPDDGAWETKVSNREKRQQRRKDKGPEDSGSPGGFEVPKTIVPAPVATAPTSVKKNRGNNVPDSLHSRTTGKGDTASRAVSSSWREEPLVNGGGWADVSLKIPGQMGTVEGPKWSTISTAPHYRATVEPQRWGQEPQAWPGIDDRTKKDMNPVSLSMMALNTTEGVSSSIELQWTSPRAVVDEWSGFNGMAAVDPTSDWNAPAEHWGNYEEPSVFITPAPLSKPKEQPAAKKESEDEKDIEDPSGGTAKSKKRRKKKKKTEEDAASEAQTVGPAPLVSTGSKPQELPLLASKKPNPNMSLIQKSEQTVELPKPSQKKKVRRET